MLMKSSYKSWNPARLSPRIRSTTLTGDVVHCISDGFSLSFYPTINYDGWCHIGFTGLHSLWKNFKMKLSLFANQLGFLVSLPHHLPSRSSTWVRPLEGSRRDFNVGGWKGRHSNDDDDGSQGGDESVIINTKHIAYIGWEFLIIPPHSPPLL